MRAAGDNRGRVRKTLIMGRCKIIPSLEAGKKKDKNMQDAVLGQLTAYGLADYNPYIEPTGRWLLTSLKINPWPWLWGSNMPPRAVGYRPMPYTLVGGL